MNKFEWNFNGISNILIHENAFENVISKISVILFFPQSVRVNLFLFTCKNLPNAYGSLITLYSSWFYDLSDHIDSQIISHSIDK